MALNIEYTTNNDEQKKTFLLTCQKKTNEGITSENTIANSLANAYFYLTYKERMNLKGCTAYIWRDTNEYFKEWNGKYNLKNNISWPEFDGYFIN